jgi:hypothetical protein
MPFGPVNLNFLLAQKTFFGPAKALVSGTETCVNVNTSAVKK